MAPPLHEAVAEVLLRLLDTRADLMVVVGSDPGPVGWVAQLRPDRFVAAPGPTSRLTVADGLRLAGCAVVTVLDAGIADLAQPASYGPAHVLLTELATHLGAAYRAGLTVMQPAWRTDVMHLAAAALDGDGSVLLRVHGRALPPPRSGVDTAPGDGAQRVLHRGRAGLVLGAGATAPDAADVARMLAGRGVDVTALDAHTDPARHRGRPAADRRPPAGRTVGRPARRGADPREGRPRRRARDDVLRHQGARGLAATGGRPRSLALTPVIRYREGLASAVELRDGCAAKEHGVHIPDGFINTGTAIVTGAVSVGAVGYS